MKLRTFTRNFDGRRHFIGGSDARIIMGADEAALIRLWREKRGEVEPEDLSGNLVVQLGVATEALNRTWYERNTGHLITDVQRWVQHPVNRWMAATLDGMVEDPDAVFEAKFMLPWSFSEEAAAEKHMAQLQHNMWVTNAKTAALSIITGGGKWVEIKIAADALYQHLLTHSGALPGSMANSSSSALTLARPRSPNTWQGAEGRHPRAGRHSCATTPMESHRLICLS